MQSKSNSQTEFYDEWRNKCRSRMIQTLKTNLTARLKRILQIVNSELSQCQLAHDHPHLQLSHQQEQQFFTDVRCAILSWKGVELSFCAKQKSTFNDYHKTSMNWFNRNKAKIYGTHFFHPLIFVHLLNFCNSLPLRNNGKIDVFVSILITILSSKVPFERTKEQPLLPYQTYMQPNSFKTQLLQFLNHFDVQVETEQVSKTHSKKVYKNDKQRSNKISKMFISALQQIKRLAQTGGTELQLFRRATTDNTISLTLDLNDTSMFDLDNDNDDSTTATAAIHEFEDAEPSPDANSHRDHSHSGVRRVHFHPHADSNSRCAMHSPSSSSSSSTSSTSTSNLSVNMNMLSSRIQSRIPYTASSLQPPSGPLHSVVVPLNHQIGIQYQFWSFSPLHVSQNLVATQCHSMNSQTP